MAARARRGHCREPFCACLGCRWQQWRIRTFRPFPAGRETRPHSINPARAGMPGPAVRAKAPRPCAVRRGRGLAITAPISPLRAFTRPARYEAASASFSASTACAMGKSASRLEICARFRRSTASCALAAFQMRLQRLGRAAGAERARVEHFRQRREGFRGGETSSGSRARRETLRRLSASRDGVRFHAASKRAHSVGAAARALASRAAKP